MKKDLYGKIKYSRPFSVFDLSVYLAVAIIFAALFLFLVILPDSDPARGFEVYYKEAKILEFDYETGSFKQYEFEGLIETREENGIYTVKIYLNKDKTDYNVLSVDKKNKTVDCTDSDCSTHKDCVYTPKITGNSGAIFCLPHQLKIIPAGGGYLPITTG